MDLKEAVLRFNWKEFFKPSWLKAALFLVFAALALHSIKEVYPGPVVLMSCPAYRSISPPLFPVSAEFNGCIDWHFPYFPIKIQSFYAIVHSNLRSVVGLVVGFSYKYHVIDGPPMSIIIFTSVMYWYLLSCISVYLFGQGIRIIKSLRKNLP
ncbi:MAG: hypothetical protein J7K22_04155 [Nanoarchaeota archaeon]|nr:hypothetical protein [Nanoarchaeota archaeon]